MDLSQTTHCDNAVKTDSRAQIISVNSVVSILAAVVEQAESGGDARSRSCLTTETVESASLPLEGVDDVERGDGLALGVLGVRDGIADYALEEGLEHSAGLFVDHYSGVSRVSMRGWR